MRGEFFVLPKLFIVLSATVFLGVLKMEKSELMLAIVFGLFVLFFVGFAAVAAQSILVGVFLLGAVFLLIYFAKSLANEPIKQAR